MESTLVCNVEKQQVIWMIDDSPTSARGNENFQPASNSTLIIKNSASDGASGGTFRVSCMGRNSSMTDGRIYRVHLTKGIINFVFISLKSSAFCFFQSGSIGQTAVCNKGGVIRVGWAVQGQLIAFFENYKYFQKLSSVLDPVTLNYCIKQVCYKMHLVILINKIENCLDDQDYNLSIVLD